MAMSTGARRGGVCADINVTPFADIMIVLLPYDRVAASLAALRAAGAAEIVLRTQSAVRTSRNP